MREHSREGLSLGCEDSAACTEALMCLSAVGHFFAALAGQHFEHALDTAHARCNEGSVVIVEVTASASEVGAFGPSWWQHALGVAGFYEAREPGIVDREAM